MHKSAATQHDELRCQCGHHADAATADLSATRFVLPKKPLFASPVEHWWHQEDKQAFLPPSFHNPPDPPPRRFVVLLT